jgi:hypothetical protein
MDDVPRVRGRDSYPLEHMATGCVLNRSRPLIRLRCVMRRRLVMTGPFVLIAVFAALLPAAASAQTGGEPLITSDPVIAGTAQVGQTLTVTAEWTGDPTPTARWQWLRCSTNDDDCSPIPGATSDRYVLTAADIGWELCTELTVTNDVGTDTHHAREHTEVVRAAPPVPATTPKPTATPSGTRRPAVGPAVVAPAETPASIAPQLLDPFPVVRIRGFLTPAGARITLFTVRVPRNVLLEVRCHGASCPARRVTDRSSARSVIRLRRFERRLRAGTRLSIKVTRRGRIGKWTMIVIRRGAAPKRSDRCAYPDLGRPAPCPGG